MEWIKDIDCREEAVSSVIEMWYNVVRDIIETAYPVYGKKERI